MFENTRRSRKWLGGIAGVNLALALAVSAGAVPHPGADDVQSASNLESTTFAEEAGAVVRQPGDALAAVGVTTTVVVPTTVAAVAAATPTTAVARQAAATAAPTTVPAGRAAASLPQTSLPQVTIPQVTLPPAVVAVARRVPAASEVQQALGLLPKYVSTILTPSPAQVAQLGNEVCTMFDQGQSFSAVKATGLQMVTQVPLTTVLPGGADWVVRTVVSLYCPGHASKLA